MRQEPAEPEQGITEISSERRGFPIPLGGGGRGQWDNRFAPGQWAKAHFQTEFKISFSNSNSFKSNSNLKLNQLFELPHKRISFSVINCIFD
jgi:hypothetical protein